MRYLTHHLLQSAAAETPDKEALVFGSDKLDYRSVWERACGLARALRDLHATRHDRVGILLGPSPQQAIALFGVAAAGAVFVPIHHSWSAAQVAHVANDCRMKTLITTSQTWESLRATNQQLPTLESLVLLNPPPPDEHLPTLDFHSCTVPGCGQVSEQGIGKDLAAILYTSGSTGLPKGVMLSHANLLAGTDIVAAYLGLQSSERILSVLPFTFDAGLNQLTTAFARGGTLVLTKFLFPGEVCKTLHSERITGLAGVPTFWGLLAKNKTFRESEFPHLRYITNTGGAMPVSILDKLRARLPHTKIFLMYGLTEAFRSTYLDPGCLDQRPTSIGKAIPNSEILVINEDGKECGAGEVGELVHDGPTVSLGYWERPQLNAKVFRPHPCCPPGRSPADTVCYSGDLVRRDEEGFLYFVGRRDHQIKTSGYRVSRTEIENALLADDSVGAAAVVGIPDELLGQQVIAFAVAAEPNQLDANRLLARCAEALPQYMVPKRCILLDALPLTGSGKVSYAELQRRAETDFGA